MADDIAATGGTAKFSAKAELERLLREPPRYSTEQLVTAESAVERLLQMQTGDDDKAVDSLAVDLSKFTD